MSDGRDTQRDVERMAEFGRREVLRERDAYERGRRDERERCVDVVQRLIDEWDHTDAIESARREAARSCLAAIHKGEEP